MGLFDSLFGSGYSDAANAEVQGLNNAYAAAVPLAQQGRDAINTGYGAALAPYTGLLGSTTAGGTAYGNATGVNGPAGNATALANFQAGPGYSWQLGQGLQGVDRGAAAKGLGTSGNALNAEDTYAQGLANQSWQQNIANLQPYLGAQQAAATGVAGVDTGQANQLASSYGQQANLAYGTQAGIGNAQGAADIASQNATNSFLQGALGLGTKLLGFGGGAGGGSAGTVASFFGPQNVGGSTIASVF
jgi:hypothetical protein